MEIEKGETSTQVPTIEFADQTGSDIALWVEEHHKQGQSVRQLHVDVETDYFKFSQEDIKTLLPYLQSFAETGELEPQESTLHVGRDALSILAEHRARYSQQFAHEKKRIQIGLMNGIINPDASQAADRLESKLEALKDLEDDLAQSPLQGGDERVESIANASAKHVLDIIESLNSGIASMQDVVLAMAQNIVDQGKRIQALEQLMREWKKFGQSSWESQHPASLVKQTDDLLGE